MAEYIGGQAVVEGVMMCSRKKMAVAVRKPDGKIIVKTEKRSRRAERWKNVLFLRGLVALFEMLVLGTRALTWSSNQQLEKDEQIGGWGNFFMILFSIALGVGLFILLPLWLSGFTSEHRVWFNLVDGFWRVAIFIVYLWLISRMKDIKTVFQYHGAEHKAVHCYEAKKPLTVKNVQSFTTVHPRCGTAFIFIVLIISILLFSVVWSESWILKFVYRLILIPVIGMISYELLRASAKYENNVLLKVLTAPGLWLQKITTQEPTDKQCQVSIRALKAAM